MNMTSDLLTIDEVATELKVSYESARQLTISGKLPYVSVTPGKQRETRRVRRDTLDAFKRAEKRSRVADEMRHVRNSGIALGLVEQRW